MTDRKYAAKATVTNSWEEDGSTTQWATSTARHGPWVVTARWKSIDGRISPASVTIDRSDGAPVNADGIRKLPIGEMLVESRQVLLAYARKWKDQAPESYEAWGHRIVEPILAAAKGPQRGRQLTDDELQQVVDVYRRARLVGEPVNAAVQRLGLSRDGAAKRIGRARAWLRERGEEL